MKILIKFFLVFLSLGLVVLLADRYLGAEFKHKNYWDYHGVFFLAFLALFPRLTLLFSSVASGGILWWLSWLFVPRFLIAALATVSYWHQNPILVTLSWLIAISAESSEKFVVIRRGRFHYGTYPRGHRRPERPIRDIPPGDIIDIEPNRVD